MKTAEPKTKASAAKKKTSFFGKEAGQGFFPGGRGDASFFSGADVQAKLTVGQPNDGYEKEADAMADKVVQRSGDPNAATEPIRTGPIRRLQAASLRSAGPGAIQEKCAHCEDEEKKDQPERPEKRLQKKPIFDSNAEPPDDD